MVDPATDRDAAADRAADDTGPTDTTAASEAAFDVAPELFGAAPGDGDRHRVPDDAAL
ncbi:hypothetical protein I7X12_11400 [Halosimplex litoreum]|uniref:Uncharacterized protein n=1 Tax=Halosimplex litoreum TaxID=1198301 RepID=A0A7T3FVZ4_9EURY|nr:hypothetical protein [Halosimplex litoreum]QPV61373.1 hypothetical protein I7X12_11400 [Halosimplex litoreum]